MTDKPLTRNTSLIELFLTVAGFLVLGGIAWGSLASEQKNLSEKVDQEHEEIVAIRKDVSDVKEEQAAMKERIQGIDDRTIRILDAVDRINERLPNGN